MKYLIGVLLLAFAFPSWAEDDVWYCVEEHRQGVVSLIDGKKETPSQWGTGDLVAKEYSKGRFTLKWDMESNQILLSGESWCVVKQCPYALECEDCMKERKREDYYFPLKLNAVDRISRFALQGKNYFYAHVVGDSVRLAAGTCTKF